MVFKLCLNEAIFKKAILHKTDVDFVWATLGARLCVSSDEANSAQRVNCNNCYMGFSVGEFVGTTYGMKIDCQFIKHLI